MAQRMFELGSLSRKRRMGALLIRSTARPLDPVLIRVMLDTSAPPEGDSVPADARHQFRLICDATPVDR
jgi:hypothetical protein